MRGHCRLQSRGVILQECTKIVHSSRRFPKSHIAGAILLVEMPHGATSLGLVSLICEMGGPDFWNSVRKEALIHRKTVCMAETLHLWNHSHCCNRYASQGKNHCTSQGESLRISGIMAQHRHVQSPSARLLTDPQGKAEGAVGERDA